jgi:hypothetical protein
MAADAARRCGGLYIGPEHRHRRGEISAPPPVPPPARARERPGSSPETHPRERIAPTMTASDDSGSDLEAMLRRVIREETGLTDATPAEKWRGGSIVLRPGKPGLQEKSWPIDTFFHKIVMLRNRLRTLEQHVNASELPDEGKLAAGLHHGLLHRSRANVLFADRRISSKERWDDVATTFRSDRDITAPADGEATVVLAGGCFWCAKRCIWLDTRRFSAAAHRRDGQLREGMQRDDESRRGHPHPLRSQRVSGRSKYFLGCTIPRSSIDREPIGAGSTGPRSSTPMTSKNGLPIRTSAS